MNQNNKVNLDKQDIDINNNTNIKESVQEEVTQQDVEKLKDEIRNRMSEEDVNHFEENEEVSPEEMAEEIQKIETEKELKEYFEDNHSIDIAESFEELDDD